MADGSFRVSHSKISTYRACRQRYWFKYVEKLRRRRKARPLVFGGMMHELLDAWKEGDDPFELLDEMAAKQGKLFRREVEEYGDIVEDTRVILTEYLEHWKDDSFRVVRFNKKSAEHEFEVPLTKDILLVGKVDAIAKRNGLKWMVEHKTFGKAIPDENKRWRNLQSATYIKVINILGWPRVDGTLWDYIGSKPPSKPQVLKDGKLSQKRIVTLPTRVRETLDELKLNVKHYPALISAATQCRKQYFQRFQNAVNEEVVEHLWQGTVAVAQEMENLHGKVKDMTVDFHCDRCDYEPLCRARLCGLDVDYVKEREYEIHNKDKK